MFKKLFCHHDFTTIVKKGEWFPSFHTTNGLADEDERLLVFRCNDCNKRIGKTQVKSHGMVMNFKDIN
jgi:hypothetical protein